VPVSTFTQSDCWRSFCFICGNLRVSGRVRALSWLLQTFRSFAPTAGSISRDWQIGVAGTATPKIGIRFLLQLFISAKTATVSLDRICVITAIRMCFSTQAEMLGILLGLSPAKKKHQDKTHLRKRRKHTFSEKTELEQEIEITALTAKLARLKTSSEFKIEKSKQEALRESFTEHDAHMMGALMLADEERAKNIEQYKDDPEMLEKKELSLKAWLETQQL